MYERRDQPLISAARFRRRLLAHVLLALLVLLGSLALGTAGYVYFEGMNWQEGFLNASMLLSGIGLAAFPETPAAQLFASVYALYAGLVFLLVTGIVVAPILHRFLHRFHWIDED